MGFITNQWLMGATLRDRIHSPVKVKLKARNKNDSWSKRNGVVCSICATQKKGDYQNLYLTRRDLAALLPILTGRCNAATLKEVAQEALSRLDSAALIETLEIVFALRKDRVQPKKTS